LATLPEDQRATLVQVLQMTPDQIALLDPTQQASVNELVCCALLPIGVFRC
jgi:hypothetical protein